MRRLRPLSILLAGLGLLVYGAFYLRIPLTPHTRFLPQMTSVQAAVLFSTAIIMILIGVVRMIIKAKPLKRK